MQPPTSIIFISTWTRWRRWAKRSSNSVFGQVASSWWSWLSWWSQPSSSSSSSQSPSPTRSWRWHHRLQLPRVVLRRCLRETKNFLILHRGHPSSTKGCPFFKNSFWHCPNSVCPSPPPLPLFGLRALWGIFLGAIFYHFSNFTKYMRQTILARVLTPVSVSVEVSEQGELELRRVKICFRHRVRVCRRACFRYLSDQLCGSVQVNLKMIRRIHEVYDNHDDDDNHNAHHNYDRLPHSDDDNQVCTCQLSS